MGRLDPNLTTPKALAESGGVHGAPVCPPTTLPGAHAHPPVQGLDGTASGACWVKRTDERWRWQVDPHWLGLMEGPQRLDFMDLTSNRQTERVKANDGREVWRVQVGPQVGFAKLYRPAQGWSRLRHWLRGTDAQNERTIADYAAQHGIPTVKPVAIAEARKAGQSPAAILITQAVDGARALDEVWEEPSTRTARNQLIEAVAQLLAYAHQCGFEHFDLHAGNILVQCQEADSNPTDTALSDKHRSYRALFVDLHNIRTGRAIRDDGVIRNLAQFNQWFAWHASLSDRIRFLRRYLDWRDRTGPTTRYGRKLRCDERELLRQLSPVIQAHAQSLYAKRDRRCLRTGRYFAKLTLPDGWRAHVFLQCKYPIPGSRASQMVFTVQQWRQWLREPLRWVRPTDRSGVIKDSSSSFVCRTQLPANDHSEKAIQDSQALPSLMVICKHSRARHLFKALVNAPRSSRPMQTWRLANALLGRQIPTARPLAVLDRRQFGLLTDSLLIAEHIDQAHDLDTILTVQMRELSTRQQCVLKRQIARELATVLRRMHERGFAHRDLKAPNVMVQWNSATDDPPRILLVDLDGLRLRGSVPSRLERRALARLNISLDHCRRVNLTDRARFLRHYLRHPGCPNPAWKTLWRELAALSDRARHRRDHRHAKDLKKYGRF